MSYECRRPLVLGNWVALTLGSIYHYCLLFIVMEAQSIHLSLVDIVQEMMMSDAREFSD